MELKGKRAVVTGGAMGIGYSTVLRLLNEGCVVTIWDINPEKLAEAQQALNSKGIIFAHQCDVTDKNRVYELGEIAVMEMGGVDILVNNAGYVASGYFLENTDEQWEKTISVNLTSFIYTIRAFLPQMNERNSGHIVNISSASSVIGVPGLAVYTASKWAVWGLTESLRFESKKLGKKGVKFSTVHPSYIKTGMFEGAKIPFPGGLIVPLVKNHDVIAKTIVERILKRGALSPKKPWTVNLAMMMRGFLPDPIFQKMIELLKISDSMKTFKGREK
ncbi:MAG: SDR family NAD(P)-dependent oxidoreductase [Ignavibacteriaceae bacterium]|nr:SDR family NAD(P)-dependent oxidoreductase [Ignavibacteriaceae bacterium]